MSTFLTGLSCDETDNNLSNECIVGIFPSDTLYRAVYKECYSKSFWVEVIKNDAIGKDVTIYTPAPILSPNPQTEYNNVVETPFPDQLHQPFHMDTLLGKKIYFQYRLANESEIKDLRNDECEEAFHEIPVVILEKISFSRCPNEEVN